MLTTSSQSELFGQQARSSRIATYDHNRGSTSFASRRSRRRVIQPSTLRVPLLLLGVSAFARLPCQAGRPCRPSPPLPACLPPSRRHPCAAHCCPHLRLGSSAGCPPPRLPRSTRRAARTRSLHFRPCCPARRPPRRLPGKSHRHATALRTSRHRSACLQQLRTTQPLPPLLRHLTLPPASTLALLVRPVPLQRTRCRSLPPLRSLPLGLSPLPLTCPPLPRPAWTRCRRGSSRRPRLCSATLILHARRR